MVVVGGAVSLDTPLELPYRGVAENDVDSSTSSEKYLSISLQKVMISINFDASVRPSIFGHFPIRNHFVRRTVTHPATKSEM
eukprot:scaffold4420_cov187-Amphora_coffeaeformis.AAC.11